jgi:O-6-methylguanine DNA methyltransferase
MKLSLKNLKLKPKKESQLKQPASFRAKVFEVVRQIKRGETLTYKEVALRSGNGKAARAVGAILHTNYDPKIPCHRVIRSDGKLGGYNRGIKNKRRILDEERLVNF